MLERWTRGVVRWRVAVLCVWAGVALLGSVSAVRLPALLTTSLGVPGTSSAAADSVLVAHFGENVEGSFTVVVRVPDATAAALGRVRRELVQAAASVPSGRIVAVQGASGVVFGTVATRLDLQRASAQTDALRRALRAAGLSGALVTGPPAIQHDVTPVLAGDLRIGEVVALLLALVLLVFALGWSWAVVVPLAVGACTVSASLLVIYMLAHRVLMVLYVPNVVELIGLGLAIDYSLLMVHRFREEADAAAGVDDAVVATARTAGRTVALSAIAVALGLSALIVVPVPFVRSLGSAGLVVPAVSLLAALTLQPALLSVFARGVVRAGGRTPRELGARTWGRIAALVLHRPGAVLAATATVLVLCAMPAAWLQLTPGSIGSLPFGLESARGAALLANRVGPGAVSPIQVVVDSGSRGGARTPGYDAATLRAASAILNNPEVLAVAVGPSAPYMDASGRYRQIIVVGRHEFGAGPTQRLVRWLDGPLGAARFPAGARIAIGGAPAQGTDFLDRVYGAFPWVIALVLALAFAFLLAAFRSLLLAALAVVLDLVTLAATYGLLVVVFEHGVGADLAGLYRAPQIEGWVPVLLFALLFGLSMDYQVFLVMRMRESHDAGADTPMAITDGLVHTGRVVSTASVIFVAAMIGLMGGRVAGLQELGVGLALGVLLDATVVRGLLLPSVMALVGPGVWWLPMARRTPAPTLATRETGPG